MALATVASLNVALVASTGRFVSALSQAERSWNNFARTVQRGAKTLPTAIQEATPASLTLARYAMRAGAAIVAALSAMALWGMKLEAQWESTRAAFATLLGGAQQADQFLAELYTRYRGNPFGTKEMQDAARQLLAFGFSAQKTLDMLGPIGDAVAAMGGDAELLDRVVLALGQMQAKSKVSAEEMLQLTEAGIPAWQMLAQEIGVSVPQAMKMAQKGAISSSKAIDALLRGMEKRYKGAMQAQANTLSGMRRQFQDSMAIIARGLGQATIRVLGLDSAFRLLVNSLGQFAAMVQQFGLGVALQRLIPPWLQVVIVGIAGAIAGGLVPALVAFLLPALRKVQAAIAATGLSLRTWMIAGAAVAVVIWLLARHWTSLGDVTRRVWALISAVVMYGASVVVRGLGAILQVISYVIPGLRGVAQAVTDTAQRLRAAAAQALATARASSAVAATAGAAARGTQAIGQAAKQMAGTAQQAADAQDKLGKSTAKAAKKAADNLQSFDEVHQIQQEMADSAEDAAAGLGETPAVAPPAMDAGALGGGLGAGLGGLADQMDGLLGRIRSVWESAVNFIGGLWQRLKQWALDTFPWLRDVAGWFAAAADWIRDHWDVIGPILGAVVDAAVLVGLAFLAMSSPIGAVIAIATAAAGLFALIASNWQSLAPTLGGIWEAVKANLIAIWDTLKAAAIAIWDGIKAAAITIWSALRAWWASWGDTVKAMWQGYWQAVLVVARFLWNEITLVIQAAIGLIQHVIGFFLDLITGDWQGAWQNIVGIAQTIWTFLVGTWQNVQSLLIGLWNVLVQTAIAVWFSLQDNIRRAWTAVQMATTTVWNAIAGFLRGLWTGIVTTVATTWQTIQQTVATWWNNVKAATEAVWNALTGWLGGIWAGLSNTVASTWQAIWQTVSTWWGNVKAKTQEVWNAVNAWLGQVWSGIVSSASYWWGQVKAAIGGLLDQAKARITSVWSSLASSLSQIWAGIRDTAGRIWDGIIDRIRGSINNVISAINRFLDRLSSIRIHIPEVNIPLVGTVGGGTIGFPAIPHIPMLAEGGTVVDSGLALVGEAGPELLELPRGARVTPLSGGGGFSDDMYQAVFEAVVDAFRTAQAVTAGGGDRTIILKVGERELARAVLPGIIAEGQRQGLHLVVRPQGV